MMFKWRIYTVVCIIILLAAPAEVFSAASVDDDLGDDLEFASFKIRFQKSYSSEQEESYRRDIFLKNLVDNREKQSSSSYQIGVTQFSDLTLEEFKSQYLTLKPSYRSSSSSHRFVDSRLRTKRILNRALPSRLRAPASLNWVAGHDNKAYNVSVLDQGSCGACWAFATTQCIEANRIIKRNENFVRLSVEQMTECCPGNGACQGGTLDNAFNYVFNIGLMEWPVYSRPYCAVESPPNDCTPCYLTGTTGFDPQSLCSDCGGCAGCCDAQCNVTLIDSVIKSETNGTMRKIADFVNWEGDENELMDALAEQGPLAVAINADWMSSYTGGIAEPTDCGAVNHAVLLVGYGTEAGKSYWLIKNSWGESFGEGGYARLVKSSSCGITTDVYYIGSVDDENWYDDLLDFLNEWFSKWEVIGGVAAAVTGVCLFSVIFIVCCVLHFAIANACFGTCSSACSSVCCCGNGGGFLCCKKSGGKNFITDTELELEVSSDIYSRSGKPIF